MHITGIQLKNFRCFKDLQLSFEKPIVLLEGMNGTGKTSILEAIHYACYLRSFRTHSPQELAYFDQNSFFVKINLANDLQQTHEIKIGFSGKKRIVKIDQKNIVSYKELMNYYRVVTLTEDDLALIKEGPEVRRSFIDQVVVLYDPDFSLLLKKLKYTVESRNALFSQKFSQDHYDFWSRELWNISFLIRKKRKEALAEIELAVTELLTTHFPENVSIVLSYQEKKGAEEESFESFYENQPLLYQSELHQGRTLFGAHLDDFTIQFKQQRSRAFASRGQQKLIILLLKIAQIKNLISKNMTQPILLLDDFMTDLDEPRSNQLIEILKNLNCQLIFTCPINNSFLLQKLEALDFQKLIVSH